MWSNSNNFDFLSTTILLEMRFLFKFYLFAEKWIFLDQLVILESGIFERRLL